jgi:hypothetical protein
LKQKSIKKSLTCSKALLMVFWKKAKPLEKLATAMPSQKGFAFFQYFGSLERRKA